MKAEIRIDAAAFSKALGMLEKVITNKAALPILKSVMISYDRPRKVFVLTGSNVECRLTIEAVQTTEGDDGSRTQKPYMMMIDDDVRDQFTAICMNFAGIGPSVKSAVDLIPKAGVLRMLVEKTSDTGGTVEVIHMAGRFQLPFEVTDEYPAPSVVATKAEPGTGTPVCRFTIDTAGLLPLMKTARVCTANDELRPVMNGECLDVSHNGITIVASDGHTLFKESMETGMGWMDYGEFPVVNAETGQAGSATLLVPKPVLPALLTAFGDAARLTVTADAQCVEFTADGITLTARMIDGRYPNYNSVIPQDTNHKVVVCRDALRMALRRLNLFASEASNLGKMRRDGEAFVIEADNTEFSCAASERVTILESDAFLPEAFVIGFKCTTLISLLDCIPTENVVLFFSDDPARAFLMKPEDVKSSRVLLQMPMLVES